MSEVRGPAFVPLTLDSDPAGRCRRSDIGGPAVALRAMARQAEGRGQRSDIGGRRAEGRIQTSEDRRQGWIWGRIKIVIEEASRGQGFKGSSERVK